MCGLRVELGFTTILCQILRYVVPDKRGLVPFYRRRLPKDIQENEIVGEALIALRHEELKEMPILSVGHRLTILKGVYDIKIKHQIPIESDHYIPPCRLTLSHPCPVPTNFLPAADASLQDQTVTQEDISRIIKSIEIRDRRIQHAEQELKKITEEYKRLRDELLPVFRMAKDHSQPLPYHPPGPSPNLYNRNEEDLMSPMGPQGPPEKPTSLSRKFSTKRLFLGSTPKNNSPTHMPHSIPEEKTMADSSNLDPSAAAVAASNHLAAVSLNGGSQPATSPNQPNIPSPTSPNTYVNQQQKLPPRVFREVQTATTTRSFHTTNEDQNSHISYGSNTPTLVNDRDLRNPTPTPSTRRNLRDAIDDPSGSAGRDPQVEIFKSFRVSMEDPCHKVLPAALKKYNIQADWRQYALYIVHGDQERCLGLEEKPLILFKQLDREGRKPMFMLRKHAAPLEGHSGPNTSMAPLDPSIGGGGGGGRGHSNAGISLPGGVI